MITLHCALLGPCHFPIFHNFRKTWCITPFYIGEMIFFSDKGRIKYYIIHILMRCEVKIYISSTINKVYTLAQGMKFLSNPAMQFTWPNDPSYTVKSLTLEATPSAIHSFKRSLNINYPARVPRCFWRLVKNAKIGLSKWIFYGKNHPNLSGLFSYVE